MPPMTWDGDKDRTVLLQILSFHPAQVTTAEWEIIAQKWGNGTKGESFRKRFVKIKADHADDENGSAEGSAAMASVNQSSSTNLAFLIVEAKRKNTQSKGATSKKRQMKSKERNSGGNLAEVVNEDDKDGMEGETAAVKVESDYT